MPTTIKEGTIKDLRWLASSGTSPTGAVVPAFSVSCSTISVLDLLLRLLLPPLFSAFSCIQFLQRRAPPSRHHIRPRVWKTQVGERNPKYSQRWGRKKGSSGRVLLLRILPGSFDQAPRQVPCKHLKSWKAMKDRDPCHE